MKVAMLLSCGSFEGFFGRVQGQTRESYIKSYRNDWSWYYAGGLVENGINPILYIPSLFESGRYETDAGIPVRFLQLDRWYRPLERVWLKRLARTNPLSLYCDERLNAMAFMKPLAAGTAEDDIDLLYVQEYWSGRFDHIALRFDGLLVAADHGGVSRGVFKRFKKQAFRKAAILYCQTSDECDIVRRYGGATKLQPNGCDTSQFFPDTGARRSKTILTVARLTNRQKRTSDLLHSLAALPDEWTLDIVGTGPDLALLQRMTTQLNIQRRVVFHGFLGRARISEMLKQCGVYAMPSANEAVAIAALEAMGSGAAVVLSRIRAFESLVEHGVNGLLVPVGDAKAIAAAILEAWERRDILGKAAAETVRQRFDTRLLYRELANSLRIAAVKPDARLRPL